MKPFDYAIVWMALVMLIALRLRVVSSLPTFRVYLTFELAAWFLLWATVHMSYADYFYAYWGVTLARRAFMLLLLFEIGVEVLDRPLWIAWGLGIAFSIALAISVATTPAHGKFPLITYINVVDRATTFLVCGVYLSAASLASAFGLRWRSHVLGVSLGVAVLASLNLLYSAFHLAYLKEVSQVSYLVAICVWLFITTKEQPKRLPISPSLLAFLTATSSVQFRTMFSRSYTTTSCD